MADSQPPEPQPTDERTTSSPGSTVLKRTFSQLAMEYDDGGRPSSSSSTQANGPPTRRASDQGASGSSNSSRHSDADSHDRPDRSKRARSASFESSRDDGPSMTLADAPGSSTAASASQNTGNISDSSSDSWTAVQVTNASSRAAQDASGQRTSFEDNIAFLRAPSRSSPPRRAFVHRHSQRRPRLFARELSPSSQDDTHGASHGERASRLPNEVIMISDTESDDVPPPPNAQALPSATIASATANVVPTNPQTVHSSNERQTDRDLPSFATLFPEHRSTDASTGPLPSSAELAEVLASSGAASSTSSSSSLSHSQRSRTSDYPAFSAEWTGSSHNDEAIFHDITSHLDLPGSSIPLSLTEDRHDDRPISFLPGWSVVAPDNNSSQDAGGAPPGAQDTEQVGSTSQNSQPAASAPPRSLSPSNLAIFGELDRSVDFMDAVTTQPSHEPAADGPSMPDLTPDMDPAAARLAATLHRYRNMATEELLRAEAEDWTSVQPRLQSLRAPTGSGASTGSMALRHARLMEERDRERQRTLSLPAASPSAGPSSSGPSPTASSPAHRSGSLRRQPSGRRVDMLRSILLERTNGRDGSTSRPASDGSPEISEADRRLDQHMSRVLDLYTDQASRHQHDHREHREVSSPTRRSRGNRYTHRNASPSQTDNPSTSQSTATDGTPTREAHPEPSTRPSSVFAPDRHDYLGHLPDPFAPRGENDYFDVDDGTRYRLGSIDWLSGVAPSDLSPAFSSGMASTIGAPARPQTTIGNEGLSLPTDPASGRPSWPLTFPMPTRSENTGNMPLHPLPTLTSDAASSGSSFSSYATAHSSPSSPTIPSPYRLTAPPVPATSSTHAQFDQASAPSDAAPTQDGNPNTSTTSSSITQAPSSVRLSATHSTTGLSAIPRNPSPPQAAPAFPSGSPPVEPQVERPADDVLVESLSIRAPATSSAAAATSARSSANSYPYPPSLLSHGRALHLVNYGQPPQSPTASQAVRYPLVTFPSRPSSAAPSAPSQRSSQPARSTPLRQEPFPPASEFPQDRPEQSAPSRPSSARPTRSNRPEITQQQRTALERANALDGSLLALLDSPESSDATVGAVSRVMSALNELRQTIQQDMVDGPRRREDSAADATASTAGPSRTMESASTSDSDSASVTNLHNAAREHYLRRRLENEASEIASSDPSRMSRDTEGYWTQILREAERRISRRDVVRPSSTTSAGAVHGSSSSQASNSQASTEAPAQAPGPTSNRRRRLERVEEARATVQAVDRRLGLFSVPAERGPGWPLFSPAGALNPALSASADDRWARERRRRQELEDDLLDETSLLREGSVLSPSRFIGEVSTIEIPRVDPITGEHVGTSSIAIPVFSPARRAPRLPPVRAASTTGNRNDGQTLSTHDVPVARRTSPLPAAASRPENASTGPAVAPETNTTNLPVWDGPTPPVRWDVDLPSEWTTEGTSPQRLQDAISADSSMGDARMDVDSDEEVSVLFEDPSAMAADNTSRPVQNERSSARSGEAPIGDHVVAHSHERHRTQSVPTPGTGTRSTGTRREINLDAYHDGPFRAALARTVAIQRRREELQRIRERIDHHHSIRDPAGSVATLESSAPSASASGAGRSTTRPTHSPGPGSSSNTTAPSTSNPRLNTSTSAGLPDEDDEDTAEIQRLLGEPAGPASRPWPQPLRRTDSETVNWRRAEYTPAGGMSRAARERMYQEALERRGSIWYTSGNGSEPPRAGSSFDLDSHYRHFLHAMRDDARGGRGTSETIINGLPSGTYGEWATPGESEERCPICFEDYEESEPVLRLPTCSHWFHKPCLIQWLKTARTCPMCRTAVEPERERGTFAWARAPAYRPGRLSASNSSSGRTPGLRVRLQPLPRVGGQEDAERREGPALASTTRRQVIINAPPSRPIPPDYAPTSAVRATETGFVLADPRSTSTGRTMSVGGEAMPRPLFATRNIGGASTSGAATSANQAPGSEETTTTPSQAETSFIPSAFEFANPRGAQASRGASTTQGPTIGGGFMSANTRAAPSGGAGSGTSATGAAGTAGGAGTTGNRGASRRSRRRAPVPDNIMEFDYYNIHRENDDEEDPWLSF